MWLYNNVELRDTSRLETQGDSNFMPRSHPNSQVISTVMFVNETFPTDEKIVFFIGTLWISTVQYGTEKSVQCRIKGTMERLTETKGEKRKMQKKTQICSP